MFLNSKSSLAQSLEVLYLKFCWLSCLSSFTSKLNSQQTTNQFLTTPRFNHSHSTLSKLPPKVTPPATTAIQLHLPHIISIVSQSSFISLNRIPSLFRFTISTRRVILYGDYTARLKCVPCDVKARMLKMLL
jgi:hypothetical protein